VQLLRYARPKQESYYIRGSLSQ